MRPRLDQLEALLWIARLGSFRSAARQLHVSQPAISGRIRELETELGFAVLDRSGFRPRVTADGAEVVRYAEQMVGLATGFRRRFAQKPLLPSAIRMGAADTFALTHLSALMMRMSERHPGTQVELTVEYSANLDRKLQAGELDIGFYTAPTPTAAIVVEPLLELDLAWVAGPQVVLPDRRLAPADLLPMPIITNPRPSHLYATVADWFAGAGLVPERLHTCTSLTIMAKLASDGFGLAILPPILLRPQLARGRLRRLPVVPDLPIHRIAAAYRTDGAANIGQVAALAREITTRGRRGEVDR